MFFTSYEFLGFFLVLLVLYYSLPKKWQWKLLLLGSYLFYFAAGPWYVLYILGTTLVTYITGCQIGKNFEKQKEYLASHKEELDKEAKKAYKGVQARQRKRWLVVCLVVVVGVLAVTKYTNFVIANINSVFTAFGSGTQLSFLNLMVPLGISFYTFQAVGYILDVHRGTIQPEKNFFRFALFISFFPQVIQGPISRFGDLSQTLYGEVKANWSTISLGLQRMLWGYFKKMVVADRVLQGVSTIISEPATYHGAYALVGMVLYTVELYADFTGGIDITIGVAQCFGIKVQENFIRPYFSTSLKEYWRRWHISMCNWFRDYIFYPVSISKAMQKVGKTAKKLFGQKVGKRLPVYLSSFVVWFLTGIWHGASWNFVVWGLLNYVILMASEELEPLYAKFHEKCSWSNKAGYKVFEIFRTFLLICVLNLFDCFEQVGTTLGMLLSIVTTGNWEVMTNGALLQLGIGVTDYIVIGIGVLILFTVSFLQEKTQKSLRLMIRSLPYFVRAALWFGLFVLVLLWGAYGIGFDASQFIYNQF